jgi:redox-sensitive bicupin YhaK (pirin superfamily)
MSAAAMSFGDGSERRIVARTRGNGHGAITRLMSPSDFGQTLKPFVFLDIFDTSADFGGKMPIHPHSGIATVTVVTEGDFRFDDKDAGSGTIGYGGVEWMRAGGGVWHGGEMSAGTSQKIRGFQLWLALPADLENGPVDSQYLEAEVIPQVGPARLVIGAYNGVSSPVRAFDGVNYLLVTLPAGERWTYVPPVGHQVAFVAVSRGRLTGVQPVSEGEFVEFESNGASLSFVAGDDRDAVFVLGSAKPHPHELKLGYYSVHTSEAALVQGEARIAELGQRLREAGDRRQQSGVTPIFK